MIKCFDAILIDIKDKTLNKQSSVKKSKNPIISILGSGQYSRQILIPAFKKIKLI